MRLGQRLLALAGLGAVLLAVLTAGWERTLGVAAAVALAGCVLLLALLRRIAEEGASAGRLRTVLDSIGTPVLALDGDGCVTGLNHPAEELLGWSPEEAAGWPVWQLLAAHGEEDALRAELRGALSASSPDPLRIQHRIVDSRGRAFPAEGTFTVAHGGSAPVGTLVLTDAGKRSFDERLRDVEHRLARRLASARSGMEAADELLELIGAGLGFDHAELWLPDEADATLRIAAAWRNADLGAFGNRAAGLTVARGDDLAGLAWEAGAPVFVDDAGAVPNLARADAARHDGIRACAALPLAAGGRVVGIGVLARRGDGPLEEPLRRTLRSIGVQLGHFVERRQAERRLAEETVALASVARATRRLTEAVQAGPARQAICDAALEVSGADWAFLALPEPTDDPEGAPVIRAAAPADEGLEVVRRRFPPDTPSALLRAFATGRATFVYGSGAEPVSPSAPGPATALLQPIVHDERPIGVIGIGWGARQGALGRSIRLLVRLVADEAGMTLSRVELVGRLEAAARTDPLTGLPNRRLWEEHLARELAAAGRDGRPVSIALLDLDGLKAVNDEQGHQAGDRLLRTAAAAWEARLRAGDLLARVGGDEFAALLVGCRLEVAVPLAERLREATAGTTASLGVASWDGSEPAGTLMARADEALYAAKAAGRDRVVGR